MRTNIVFTLTGPDRVGIVETVTKMLLEQGGNVESSRMTRLGGEFAMLMLVSILSENVAGLERGVERLMGEGYKVTTSRTEQRHAETPAGWLPYRIEVLGADHEGIVHQVARYLAERGINIEAMETSVTPAPISASPLFAMDALVAVPPNLAGERWQSALQHLGDELNVDIRVIEKRE